MIWVPPIPQTFVRKIVENVASYITVQRERHLPSGTALKSDLLARFEQYFDRSLLETVRLAPDIGEVRDPAFYSHLQKFGFTNLPSFESMAAITFVDVIVHRSPLDDILVFHELVHAEQYRQLGLKQFADRYIRGFLKGKSYVNIPIEKQAYELDARFSRDRKDTFSVSDIVAKSIASEEL